MKLFVSQSRRHASISVVIHVPKLYRKRISFRKWEYTLSFGRWPCYFVNVFRADPSGVYKEEEVYSWEATK